MDDNAAEAFAQARWMFTSRKVRGAAMDIFLWPAHARANYVQSDAVVDRESGLDKPYGLCIY